MNIRYVQELSDAERTQLFGWGQDVFGIDDLGLQWRRKDWHVVVDVDDRPVSHVGVLPRMPVIVGEQRLIVGGIGGVITVPPARRRGYARLAMREAEKRIAENSEVEFAVIFCLEPLIKFYTQDGWLRERSPVLVQQYERLVESPLPMMIKSLGKPQLAGRGDHG